MSKSISSIFSKLLESKRFGSILFGLGLMILLASLWQSKFFLTGDGPTHLHNAKVLLDHWQGEQTGFYGDYYTLNSNPEPNWFGHLLLAGLLGLFPVWLAEKIFLSGIVLLFAFGARYAVRSVDPNKEAMAILAFPFLFSDPFHMGFFNFCWSLGIFFFLVGYWLRIKEKLKWKSLLGLALLLWLQYFTHPVTLVAAMLTMGGSTFFNFLTDGIPIKFTGKPFWKKYTTLGASLILAMIPALGTLLYFLSQKGISGSGGGKPFKELALNLWHMATVVFQPPQEGALAKTMLLVFILMIGIGILLMLFRDRKSAGKGLGFASILLLVLYFLSPDRLAGGGIIQMRLQLFPFLILVLWFASLDWNKVLNKVIPGIFMLFLILFFIFRIGTYRDLGDAVQEIQTVGQHIENGSTVLPLSYAHSGKKADGSPLVQGLWLFVHAADYLGAEQSLVMFDNYEGNTGFFPVIWKQDKNPYLNLSSGPGQEAIPPSVDLSAYAEKTGGSVDYVLTWCMDSQFEDREEYKFVQSNLASNYEEIFVSEQGRVKLYRWMKNN